MIHNRNICRQIDMTDEDLDIFLGLTLMCEPRKYDRQDAAVMCARTRAALRGATPIDVQKHVEALA